MEADSLATAARTLINWKPWPKSGMDPGERERSPSESPVWHLLGLLVCEQSLAKTEFKLQQHFRSLFLS